MNLSQYNLQDILEPLAKASAGTARSQYLSVSRYVVGQPSGVRRDSNISLLSNLSNSGRRSGLYNKNPNVTGYKKGLDSTYHHKEHHEMFDQCKRLSVMKPILLNLLASLTKIELPSLWDEIGDMSSGKRRLGNLNISNKSLKQKSSGDTNCDRPLFFLIVSLFDQQIQIVLMEI
ncbi:hypothetical protein NQ317_014190 [Molorchus minor]|uniref:Uncharacterized protein n=1 Tax=Molorchus minor TaxID=1323400 RepID=A0ABQ9JJ88_9CUCU|nr:hypothetical protein NQ317_014190 [Molorchus minor]